MNQPAYKFNNSARDISAISEHSSVLPKFVRQKKQCHVIKKNKWASTLYSVEMYASANVG